MQTTFIEIKIDDWQPDYRLKTALQVRLPSFHSLPIIISLNKTNAYSGTQELQDEWKIELRK